MPGETASRAEVRSEENGRSSTIKFEGDRSEGYQDFKIAAKLEIAFEDTEKAKMKLLLKMLGIAARNTLVANEPTETYSTVAQYWAALDGTYADGTRSHRAQRELEDLKQKGTPVSEFVVKFDQLCGHAGVTGTLKARMFLNKLNAGIKDRLESAGLTDYQEMKERALIVEPHAERDFKKSQKQRDENKSRKEKTSKGGKPRDGQGRYKPEKGGANRESGRETRACYLCGLVGHLARNCRRGEHGGAGYAIQYEPSRAPTPQHEYAHGGRAQQWGPPQGWNVYQPATWRVPPQGYEHPPHDERLKDAGRFESADSVQEE